MSGAKISNSIIIREVSGEKDVQDLVSLCLMAFPEEAAATGMPAQTWRGLQTDELLQNAELWEQLGIAVDSESGAVIGAVVVTVENEPESALSYWDVSRRAGCIPTLLMMCYDQVLEHPLENHEAKIDFLAVSTEARGKGVGKRLLHWAEQQSKAILRRRVSESVEKEGVLMSLWVASGNTTAIKLYEKQGYKTVHKTNDIRTCSFLRSKVFIWFLGHPVWYKMNKQVTITESEEEINNSNGNGNKEGAVLKAPLPLELGAQAVTTELTSSLKKKTSEEELQVSPKRFDSLTRHGSGSHHGYFHRHRHLRAASSPSSSPPSSSPSSPSSPLSLASLSASSPTAFTSRHTTTTFSAAAMIPPSSPRQPKNTDGHPRNNKEQQQNNKAKQQSI